MTFLITHSIHVHIHLHIHIHIHIHICMYCKYLNKDVGLWRGSHADPLPRCSSSSSKTCADERLRSLAPAASLDQGSIIWGLVLEITPDVCKGMYLVGSLNGFRPVFYCTHFWGEGSKKSCLDLGCRVFCCAVEFCIPEPQPLDVKKDPKCPEILVTHSLHSLRSRFQNGSIEKSERLKMDVQ